MFIVTITYTQPIEAIEAKTAEHREWLDQHVASGLIIAAVDTEGKPSLGWRGRRAARKVSASVCARRASSGAA